MTKRETYDVCVIGTGAGGGVMIDRITAAGMKVVLHACAGGGA
jgi:choline dehydrogenase-like flavoprotein